MRTSPPGRQAKKLRISFLAFSAGKMETKEIREDCKTAFDSQYVSKENNPLEAERIRRGQTPCFSS